MARLKTSLLCDHCGCKNQAMMLEEKMSKATVALAFIVVVALLATSFFLGHNTAMNKATEMVKACFAGQDSACQWWQAKIQESVAKQALREIEKSLTPQPTLEAQ